MIKIFKTINNESFMGTVSIFDIFSTYITIKNPLMIQNIRLENGNPFINMYSPLYYSNQKHIKLKRDKILTYLLPNDIMVEYYYVNLYKTILEHQTAQLQIKDMKNSIDIDMEGFYTEGKTIN